MRQSNPRCDVIEIVDLGRGRKLPREIPASADPLLVRLLAHLERRASRSARDEAPPPYTGSDLEFETPDRLAWPWQRQSRG